MPVKSRIVGDLDRAALLLPDQIADALVANDRAKYLFSLLQAARERADRPERPADTLRAERLACGLSESWLDTVVPRATALGSNLYALPRASTILDLLHGAVDAMIAPLRIACHADSEAYGERLRALAAAKPAAGGDSLSGGEIAALCRAERELGDSLHLLVMDLHREINALQVDLAVDTVAGAKVYNLAAGDRELVEAFGNGVARTAPLKFDHPGLATTATRIGDRLTIQNDIGTTDAHVVVLDVEGLTATLTYTDIHAERVTFFRDMFAGHPVVWNDALARRADGYEAGGYILLRGVLAAADVEALRRYLEWAGSRLVFLIDWNKTRKRLRHFVDKEAGLSLMRWAADSETGQRAFLELGGERLIFDAIEYAAADRMRYGDRLDDALGAERAVEYLKSAFRTASLGLRAGRSERSLRDEIKAELLRYFQSAAEDVLALAKEHAGFVVEISSRVRGALAALRIGDASQIERSAELAKTWESRADEVLNRARALVRRHDGLDLLQRALERGDDAADELEEAAFQLSLLRAGAPVPEALADIGGIAATAARDYLAALGAAMRVVKSEAHEELEEFLRAADAVMDAEHRADESLRRALAAVLDETADLRRFYLLDSAGKHVERATDALAHAVILLRRYVLDEAMGR